MSPPAIQFTCIDAHFGQIFTGSSPSTYTDANWMNKAPIMNSKEYFESILNSWYHGISWECKPWLTINVDPTGKIVMPCYVLNEYSGSFTVWDTDILKLWDSYPWGEFASCNKCALACYLEPSLFSWTKPSQVKSRIIDNITSFIQRQIAWFLIPEKHFR